MTEVGKDERNGSSVLVGGHFVRRGPASQGGQLRRNKKTEIEMMGVRRSKRRGSSVLVGGHFVRWGPASRGGQLTNKVNRPNREPDV